MLRWMLILRFRNGRMRGFVPNPKRARLLVSTWNIKKAFSWDTEEKARRAVTIVGQYYRQVTPLIVNSETAERILIERMFVKR